MDRERSRIWMKFTRSLPGYCVLFAGIAIMVSVVLVPAHQSLRTERWRLQSLDYQAQRMDLYAERYTQLDQAIASRMPVMVERLAYAQLRIRPTTNESLSLPDQIVPGGDAASATTYHANPELDDPADLHQWVSRPIDQQLGPAPSPPRVIGSRLARLTQGRSSYALMATASLLLIGGIMHRFTGGKRT